VRVVGGELAFGYDGKEKALWRSADGRAWERQRTSEGLLAQGRIDEFTRFGELVVAVGTADHPTSPRNNVAAVWTSSDGGTSWERTAEADPAFFVRGTTQMYGVTAGGPGLVAVGLSWEFGTNIDAHAWFSADGRTWRRASDPPAWSGPGDQHLNSVCALPAGGVVALGSVVVRGDQDAWAWVSQDGLTWERATGDGAAALAGPGLQYTTGCATTPTGVVAVGRVPGPGGFDGVLWKTVDGKTWTSVGDFAGPGDDKLVGVAADGDRLVVTGIEDDDVVVFTSADGGSTWKKRPAAVFGGFGSQSAALVAIAGDEVVMAGVDGPGGAVWIGPAP
jgi:hypothetical protein